MHPKWEYSANYSKASKYEISEKCVHPLGGAFGIVLRTRLTRSETIKTKLEFPANNECLNGKLNVASINLLAPEFYI
jgi:hypothetical protein